MLSLLLNKSDDTLYIFKTLVAALIKKRDISILVILRCSVVCVLCATMVSDCHYSSCT